MILHSYTNRRWCVARQAKNRNQLTVRKAFQSVV